MGKIFIFTEQIEFVCKIILRNFLKILQRKIILIIVFFMKINECSHRIVPKNCFQHLNFVINFMKLGNIKNH